MPEGLNNSDESKLNPGKGEVAFDAMSADELANIHPAAAEDAADRIGDARKQLGQIDANPILRDQIDPAVGETLARTVEVPKFNPGKGNNPDVLVSTAGEHHSEGRATYNEMFKDEPGGPEGPEDSV